MGIIYMKNTISENFKKETQQIIWMRESQWTWREKKRKIEKKASRVCGTKSKDLTYM